MIIDQHLTWKLHVSYVMKRVRCKMFALNRLKPLPDHLLSKLYQAFILPIFDYCDVAWAVSTSSLSKSLERLHSRFLRGISVCNPLVKITLMERGRFHTAIQVFKVLHKLCPTYLKDWFMYAEALTGRNGRNKYRLFIPQIGSCIGKGSFYYRGAVLWNNLPPTLVNIDCISLFKTTFKQLYC